MAVNTQAAEAVEITDDSTANDVVGEALQAYAAALKKNYPSGSELGHVAPFVYQAERELADAEFGISNALLSEYAGVRVIIPVYPNMAAGDTVRLYWDGKMVASEQVSAGQAGHFLTLAVPDGDVPRGARKLYFKVTGTGGKAARSVIVTTLTRVGQPGVLPGQSPSELPAPTVQLPGDGVVGPAQAKAAVKVTVPAYPNMVTGDVVTLYWGHDQSLQVRVADADVGKPVVFSVTEATIKQAGDGRNLPVYYYVQDVVGNESEWSADALVTVKLASTPLLPPVLVGSDGKPLGDEAIDTLAFNGAPVQVQLTGDFQPGDSILVKLDGTQQDGTPVPATYGQHEVNSATRVLGFDVPPEVFTALSGGAARLSYTLTRNGVSTDSPATFVTLKGPAASLPVPSVKDHDDFQVEADQKYAYVIVPVAASLQANDVLYVEWLGTNARNQQSAIKTSSKIAISANQLNRPLSVRLRGDTYLKPFDGGWADIRYVIVRNGKTYKSPLVRFWLGEPAEVLPAPGTEIELLTGVLDPSLEDYEEYLLLTLPDAAIQPKPCTVTVFFETSEGVVLEVGEQVLNADGELGDFQVQASYLKPQGTDPVDAWAYYRVDWADRPSQFSLDYDFVIATPEMLKNQIPVADISQVQGGALDLSKVPPEGLTITVNYPEMAVGDQIQVKLDNNLVVTHTVASVGPQAINVPHTAWSRLDGKTTGQLSYTVIRHPSGDTVDSTVSEFLIKGGLVYPTSENFETAPLGRVSSAVGLDLPGLTVRPATGAVDIVNRELTPDSGKCLSLMLGGVATLTLKRSARTLEFDVLPYEGHPVGQPYVSLYGENGALLASLRTPTPPGGAGINYQVMRFVYTTTGASIRSFKLEHRDNSRVTFSNVNYTPS